MANEKPVIENTYTEKNSARIQALITELGLSTEEVNALFRASNTTPDQYAGMQYVAWLEGKAPSQPINQERVIALLEMKKRGREG